MKPIASLPSCRRRLVAENQDGVRLFCAPATRPAGLTAAEAVSDPKWYRNRKITPKDCLLCQEMEAPEQQEPKEPPKEKPTHGRPRILSDGTLAYPKRGWEPPPVPAGYQRKSNDLRSPDAWVFIPTLPPCELRVREIQYTPCGAAKLTYLCTRDGQRARVVSACLECAYGMQRL